MIVVGATGPAGAPAAERLGVASEHAVAAASRCNSRTISDYQNQIRGYDAHPPRDNPGALNARLGDIAHILEALNEEHGVLDNICPSDDDKAPLFAELNATVAWALALQSDIAAKLNPSCPLPPSCSPRPCSHRPGWRPPTVNDNNGTVAKALLEMIPKVQTRAAAVGLTLPAYADTSAYWRDQVADQARQAVAICPHAGAAPRDTDAVTLSLAAARRWNSQLKRRDPIARCGAAGLGAHRELDRRIL